MDRISRNKARRYKAEEKLREAGPGDVKALGKLIRSAFAPVAQRFGLSPYSAPSHPSNIKGSDIQEAMARGVRFWLLSGEGRPLGCMALERGPEGVFYLERLAVAPRCQGQGLGRRLVEHALAQARAAGGRWLSVALIAGQHELAAWYGSLGFQEQEIRAFDHLPFKVRFMRQGISAVD